MDINLTLLGEMITFAIFVWFTMRFVWPPLMKAMNERREKIEAGIAAAEKAQRDLELAQHKVKEMLIQAKAEAAKIVEQANHRSNHIIEESKARAREEGERLMAITKSDMVREVNTAREALLREISALAIAGAEKILQHEVDKSVNDKLVTSYIEAL